jgi:outer membrane lipoprotein-sorting protein
MAPVRRATTFPAIVAAAGIVLGLLFGIAAGALSAPRLPPMGETSLVLSALRALSDQPAVSGEFRTHLDLGIPALPDSEGLGSALDLLAGDREFRLWRSDDGVRIAEMLPGAERAVIVNRTDAWTWDSESFTATHVKLDGAAALPEHVAAGSSLRFLGAVARSFKGTDSSVGEPERVAGRPAYVIVTEPDDPKTLVGRVELALDASTRTPLRAEVYPRGSDTPAISAGFTDIDFGSIDPATYAFEPPAGATVNEKSPARSDALDPWHSVDGRARDEREGDSPGGAVRRFGRGWSTVAAVRVKEVSTGTRSLLPFSGTLFSAALVERGEKTWILTGAVPQGELQAAAAKIP